MKQSFAESITLKDVAERAQVSQSTVSRALSHPDKVALKTRERVLKVAAELKFQPNHLARGLRQQNTRIIGLVLADILNDFHAHVAKGVQDAAYQHGFMVMLCSTDEDSKREEDFLQELHRHRFRGLIIVPTERTRSSLHRYQTTPVVEVDRASGFQGAHVILSDNLGGSKEAVRHLVQLGHKKIALVGGRVSVTTGEERLRGFQEGMKEAGLPIRDEWVVTSQQHNEEQGHEAARSLLALRRDLRPSAIFGFNSEVTAGILRATNDEGLIVPRDVSVLGFDDSRWVRLMSPALTVVAQPAYDMGYLAAERLFSLFSRPDMRGTVTRLATNLVIRQSTAPPHESV